MSKSKESLLVAEFMRDLNSIFDKEMIFSKPIEKNGVIVIPVGKILCGGGGGEGTHASKKGYGGGMGVYARAIGYIEINNNETRFVAIANPVSYALLVFAVGVSGYIVLRGLGKLFR